MRKEELINRLKEISGEITELSRECGREIKIASPTKDFSTMQNISIGNPLDGYAEYFDAFISSGKWVYMTNTGIIHSLDDFDMTTRKRKEKEK